jgi:hypothetical protein
MDHKTLGVIKMKSNVRALIIHHAKSNIHTESHGEMSFYATDLKDMHSSDAQDRTGTGFG